MKHAVARAAWVTLAALLVPDAALAHLFVQPYILPVPVWMYLYGSVATLVVSFAIICYFIGVPVTGSVHPTVAAPPVANVNGVLGRPVLGLARVIAVGCLLLTIVAGLIGTQNSLTNINMTLFWIVFLLGFTYLTAVIGNVYELINPWRSLVRWAERLGLDLSKPRMTYPEDLGYYPAFLFYVALIWIELFANVTTYRLSLALLVYTLLTVAGAWLFGQQAWFRYGELFSVFLGLVGRLAPVEYRSNPAPGQAFGVRLRWPFAGALEQRPEHMSLVLFVLFMLSSTTYDGIRDTIIWVTLFWKHLWALLQPFWGISLMQAYPRLLKWYFVYQRLGLLLSPFVYLGLYLAILAWAKAAARSPIPLRTLALEFAYSLIPIAFVYHVTHYFTLVLDQGPNLPRLFSDPFGFGWNLLRLAPPVDRLPIGMGFIWHTQVALILGGHIVSVYLAHVIALRVFPTQRRAVASQIPMLLLMVLYTAIGLWVLSLPIAAGIPR
ncbi:MAG: hypothetical protein HY574_12950 [candidate division NC10 bacterium]|nr:hypothetical protein [candidate division NC10 bacterium]